MMTFWAWHVYLVLPWNFHRLRGPPGILNLGKARLHTDLDPQHQGEHAPQGWACLDSKFFLSLDDWEVLGNKHHTSTDRIVWGLKEIIPVKYLANMLIHSHSYPSPWLCWHCIFSLGGLRWGIWGSFNVKEKNREQHLSTFRVWCALILKMIRWAKQSILLPVYWGEKHRHKKYNGLSKITGRWRPVTQTSDTSPSYLHRCLHWNSGQPETLLKAEAKTFFPNFNKSICLLQCQV